MGGNSEWTYCNSWHLKHGYDTGQILKEWFSQRAFWAIFEGM